MFWKEAGYAALCISIPVLWGLAVYRISSLIEKKALRQPPTQQPTAPQEQDGETPGLPLDYHI